MTIPFPPERIVAFDGGSVAAHDIGRQFDHHAKSVRELIDFIRTVVRDDGRLRNSTIGPEQLSPEISRDLARDIVSQAESLLAATKKSAMTALTAAADARDTKAAVDEKLLEIARNVSVVQRSNAQAKALLARIPPEIPRKAPSQTDAPLAAGALGPGAGGFYGVDALGAAATAQDYAQVAMEWAEHMPDTIPPNILAINAITSDHWSSRWWANRSANAFGMLAWWYQGAWPSPGPLSTPNTPTGQPLPPGAMYWNTTTNQMLVWNGSGWVPAGAVPAKAAVASLYYTATAGQTVFPMSVLDKNGKTFAFNQTTPEGLQTLVNGVRVEPTDDFAVNTVNSTVTFARPLRLNDLAIFDLLTPASQLAPSGTATTYLLNPITPNGVLTTFSGLTIALNGHAVNTAKNEELLVSVNGIQQAPGTGYTCTGASITFSAAPDADAKIFIVWFGPQTPP